MFAGFASGIACGSDHVGHDASPLERSIASAVGARLGVPVVVRCWGVVGCVTRTPAGEVVPIITWPGTNGEWEWRVDGLVVASDLLEGYLREVIAEMGVAQEVRCAPTPRWIAPDDRVECSLAKGGKAFVTVRADGSTSVEVELDKGAADARSEVVTPARDDQMTRASRALENAEQDDEDDEDGELNGNGGQDGTGPANDAGIPSAPGMGAK